MKTNLILSTMTLFLAAACSPALKAPKHTGGLPAAQRTGGGVWTAATDKYGPLVIPSAQFTDGFDYQASFKPWSAYWFPINDTYLFQGNNGNLSPLEKYDQYVSRAHQQYSDAALTQKSDRRLYNDHADASEGRCNAWANAAISVPQPTHCRKLNGIEFSVQDQKALLVLTFEVLPVDSLLDYGMRNNGNNGHDSQDAFDDIYPDQLQRLVQVQLGDQARPVVVDTDPGVEVWNSPLYRYTGTFARDASNPDVVHVDAWGYRTQFLQDPDEENADHDQVPVKREYTYDLYGTFDAAGNYHVAWGRWTDHSVEDHPDFATVVEKFQGRHSLNQKINTGFVDEILSGGEICD
ncbi:MAG: hypothetical protein ACXWPM_08060 [Bdellovibrionota bacterium]